MPCYQPLNALALQGGRSFANEEGAWADRPLGLPCGKCIGCRKSTARSWTIRCVHEAQMHEFSSFVTLTYDDESLPADWSVQPWIWQGFAKKLRKAVGPFRFLMCAEYGAIGLRPHYHALLFGPEFADAVRVLRNGREVRESPTLQAVWKGGQTDVQPFSEATAAYVCGYVIEKLDPPGSVSYVRRSSEFGTSWRVRRPFRLMSRRPGIGAKWFDRFRSDVFPSDVIVHNGQKYRPPRFYTDRLDLEERERIREKRRAAVEKAGEELTAKRLRVRERVAEGRRAFFSERGLE